MQKLESRQEKEAKEQKTKTLASVFMVIILVASVASFALFWVEDNSSSSYNKHDFVYDAEGWKTSVKSEFGDYYIVTTYHPEDVESIEFLGNEIKKENFESIVYLVSKTESERNAAEEISKNLLAQKKGLACLPENADSEECANMTLRSCSNANNLQKIIVFKETDNNEASIDYSNNCITIKGNEYNIIKAADKAVFLMFGIIKN